MNPKARKILKDSVKLAATSALKSEMKLHWKLHKSHLTTPALKIHHKETCQLIYGELVSRKHHR